ncbi:O-antigen ligase family protein [Natrialba sp. PRR66]|uniref:O-antigen ligase family protein n=1 Tax=Natrialba sp. PRR66 TaxID=3098146 RepID=UPI002B1CF53D|nr:O-antigen ligase family protein [Natrialba sp. PRR66]
MKEKLGTQQLGTARIVDDFLQRCLPKEEPLLRTSLICAVSLVVALAFVVPIFAIFVNVPVPISVVVIGVVYAVAIISNDIIFEGVTSAALVLLYVHTRVPLVDGPVSANIDIMLLDPVLVSAVLLLITSLNQKPFALSLSQKTVIASFGALIVWAFLSALVGNGPSRIAAFAFVLDQLRFFLLFLLGLLVVHRMTIGVVLYTTGIAVVANLVYAFVEVIHGRTLGLTYLGDQGGHYLSVVDLGLIQFQTGLYAGGIVGNSRHLWGITILFLPLAVLLSLHAHGIKRVLSVATVVLGSLVFVVAETDAGLLAVISMLGITTVYIVLQRQEIDYTELQVCKRTILRQPKVIAGLITVLVCILGFVAYVILFVIKTTQAGESQLFIFSLDTLSIRLIQYVEAVKLWIEHPAFGIGGYNFVAVSESYLPRQMSIHNTFLSYLAEVGLPGFLAFCLAVAIPFCILFRRLLTVGADDSSFWFALFLGMAGFVLYSLLVVVYSHVPTQGTFWLIAGATMGSVPRRQ